ncbi:MAG: universal stress protein [Phenylobacterium sp.]|nr:universal stress protein [Phenylobacterium sp.]
MSNPSWHQGPPRTILLASDLSSRCDRAMQRALQLAKLWKSRLVILTVIEPDDSRQWGANWDLPRWRRPTDPARMAAAQFRRQFGDIVQEADVRVLEGEPADAIAQMTVEIDADLIVVGVARDELFGRLRLGSTVDQLARQSPAPLLIVKSRVWPYEEILVATDFSEPSKQALIAADRFFPTAPLTVLHGWEAPFAAFLEDSRFRSEWKAREKQGCEDFLARSNLSFPSRARVKVLIENGCPEVLVRQYMLDREVDLVVIGAHGRTGALHKRLGDTARRILEYAPGDVLLIREPQAERQERSTAEAFGD